MAIYIRWSTDDQSTGTTLETQREGCEFYLRSQGWQVREDLTFVDDGYSGGNLDRPGMDRLREKVATGDVDCVVVLKIDRLSRNIVDAVDLVLREWEGHCYIKSVREPIDTTTDLGRVIFGILAMFADFERATIRERTQTGKTRRIAAGKQLHGEPAFGYLRHPTEKGRWVENPDETPLLRRIFEMAAQGVSANAICRELNREGLRTRAGKEWSIRGVLHILHNRIYIGEYVYGRTSLIPDPNGTNGGPPAAKGTLAAKSPRRKRIRVTHDKPKIVGRTDAAPPLIDQATFERAQAQLEANRSRLKQAGSKAMSSPNLLVGLARCTCGGALVHKDPTGQKFRGKKGYRYYLCMRSRHGLCNENGYIPAPQAEQAVEQAFLQLFGVESEREDRFRPHIAEATQGRASLVTAIRNAEQELAKLDSDDQRLLREARSGKLALQDLHDLRKSITRDREELQNRLDTLRQRLADAAIASRSLEVTLKALKDTDRWGTLEPWQKRQLLSMVLRERIVISKPKGAKEISVNIPWAF